MALDDFFADGKSDACSGVLGLGMESFEGVKNLFEEVGFNADAIVATAKNPIFFLFGGAEVDLGNCAGTMIFQGVFDEVLQQLSDLEGVALDFGEGIDGDLGVVLGDRRTEAMDDLVGNEVAIDLDEGAIGAI
jgi:hypothetical protein